MIKSHVFRGTRYKFFFRAPRNKNHWGTCSYTKKEIEVRPSLNPEDKLNCIIHEALHACFPDLIDEAIDESATCVAKLLMRLGYERKEDEK